MNQQIYTSLSDLTFSPMKVPEIPEDIFDKFNYVNRLIIVGNGFDLAHGLRSSFIDFVQNYSLKSIKIFLQELDYNDPLISINTKIHFSDANEAIEKMSSRDAFQKLLDLSNHTQIKFNWNSSFFKTVISEIENKNWVDIEVQYFDQLKGLINNEEKIKKLNKEFEYIKSRFIEYLDEEVNNNSIMPNSNLLLQFKQNIKTSEAKPNTIRNDKMPDRICILNFNYTKIAEEYGKSFKTSKYSYIPIHGQLENKDILSQEPIFGFGDEIDYEYAKFELLRNDELYKHIKSFKYLQFNHYRNLLEFIESNPYQIQIFGHSCGLSDRTLLNTIFEHQNCISIKPFYFYKDGIDDYEQKSYSIARHFNSKSELREKVVNKLFCEAMVQPKF